MATGFINDDFGVNIESVQLQQYFGVQYSNFNLYYSSAYVIANIDQEFIITTCVFNIQHDNTACFDKNTKILCIADGGKFIFQYNF